MKEAFEILLVEDNEDDIALTLRAFKHNKLDSSLKIVRDGEEALAAMRECATAGEEFLPKLVLLDLKLPRVDGFEVLEQLKLDPVLRLVPVVALTSSREKQDVAKCYRLGVNSYIVKPLDFQTFLDAVEVLARYWLLLNQSP